MKKDIKIQNLDNSIIQFILVVGEVCASDVARHFSCSVQNAKSGLLRLEKEKILVSVHRFSKSDKSGNGRIYYNIEE